MQQRKQDLGVKIMSVVLLSFLLVWLGVSLFNYYERDKELKREFAILASKIAVLKERNEELKNESQNLKNSEFIEQQAKERFNFQKVGEHVVVFVDQRATPSVAAATSSEVGFFTKIMNFFTVLFR